MTGATELALGAPIFCLRAIDREEANRCLTLWGHRMGAWTRPTYRFESCHGIFQHDQIVGVTVAGETPREVVGDTGLQRHEVVELGRLCAAEPGLCRVMLRLWRRCIFPDIARAHRRSWAVSYQDESLHSGNTYRFDGWVLIGRGGGGGTDQRSGRKGRSLAIWGWHQDKDIRQFRAEETKRALSANAGGSAENHASKAEKS